MDPWRSDGSTVEPLLHASLAPLSAANISLISQLNQSTTIQLRQRSLRPRLPYRLRLLLVDTSLLILKRLIPLVRTLSDNVDSGISTRSVALAEHINCSWVT